MDYVGIAAIIAALSALVTSVGTAFVMIRKSDAINQNVLKADGSFQALKVEFNSKMSELMKVLEAASILKGAKEEGERRDRIDAAEALGAKKEQDRQGRAPPALAPVEKEAPVKVEDHKVETAVRALGVQQDQVGSAVQSLDQKVADAAARNDATKEASS